MSTRAVFGLVSSGLLGVCVGWNVFLKGEEGLGFVLWFVRGHENGSKAFCFLWFKEAGTQKDVSKASLIRQHLEGFGGSQQQSCDFHVAAFACFTQKGIKST